MVRTPLPVVSGWAGRGLRGAPRRPGSTVWLGPAVVALYDWDYFVRACSRVGRLYAGGVASVGKTQKGRGFLTARWRRSVKI